MTRLDDGAAFCCDLCDKRVAPEHLSRIRTDVVVWANKKPTVHADVCRQCESLPIAVLLGILRGKLAIRERELEAKRKEKGS